MLYLVQNSCSSWSKKGAVPGAKMVLYLYLVQNRCYTWCKTGAPGAKLLPRKIFAKYLMRLVQNGAVPSAKLVLHLLQNRCFTLCKNGGVPGAKLVL